MIIHFKKYHGTGNDFIIIDNRENKFQLSTQQISFLCDRHLGIGADGLMLLENASNSAFKMRYYNSDGKEGSMCGNGGRCIVAFAKTLNIFNDEVIFDAIDGFHHAVANNEVIKLKMNDVDGIEKIGNDYFLNTGSPHFVSWVVDLKNRDVFSEGKAIRYNDRFSKVGTNVNFIERQNDFIAIRTYERGVENETLSCGTGNVAAAIVSALENQTLGELKVQLKTLGGKLTVSFDKINNTSFKNIWLEGPATFVFVGEINL